MGATSLPLVPGAVSRSEAVFESTPLCSCCCERYVCPCSGRQKEITMEPGAPLSRMTSVRRLQHPEQLHDPAHQQLFIVDLYPSTGLGREDNVVSGFDRHLNAG